MRTNEEEKMCKHKCRVAAGDGDRATMTNDLSSIFPHSIQFKYEMKSIVCYTVNVAVANEERTWTFSVYLNENVMWNN